MAEGIALSATFVGNPLGIQRPVRADPAIFLDSVELVVLQECESKRSVNQASVSLPPKEAP